MKLTGEGKLLRIFIGEDDHHHGKSLFEAIVLAARSNGLAGASVLHGVESYGASSRIHTAKILRLSRKTSPSSSTRKKKYRRFCRCSIRCSKRPIAEA